MEHNELRRLSFLRSLNILDTPIEERFERKIRLARKVLDVPIGGISLVDEGRQWFKSIQGINIIETPRDESFCHYTIMSDSLLVASDSNLHEDERFKNVSCVINEPKIRFYAGYPLIIAKDIRIGALFVCDTKPRNLSDEDGLFIADMAVTIANDLKADLLTDIYQPASFVDKGTGL